MNRDDLLHSSTFSQATTETMTIYAKTCKIGAVQHMNEYIWGITCRDVSPNKIFSNMTCGAF